MIALYLDSLMIRYMEKKYVMTSTKLGTYTSGESNAKEKINNIFL